MATKMNIGAPNITEHAVMEVGSDRRNFSSLPLSTILPLAKNHFPLGAEAAKKRRKENVASNGGGAHATA